MINVPRPPRSVKKDVKKDRIICYIDTIICDPLRELLPFVQFKKREKHSWWSATFS